MKLFGSTKKLKNKTKNGENVLYLEVAEVGNLVFLKTYNTEFDEIIIKFTDQNSRPLEIDDKVNLTLLINKQK